MLDTFLYAADLATMQAQMPPGWWQTPEDDQGTPEPAKAFWFPTEPGVQIMPSRADMSPMKWITTEAVWDNTDPENPILTTPEAILPGYSLWMAENRTDVTSWATMPQWMKDMGDILQLMTDRVMWSKTPLNPNYMIYVHPSLTLVDSQLSPTLAGVSYPFREMPPAWWANAPHG